MSPQVVFVALSGKMVLEVAASGTYGFIIWVRNGNALGASSAAPAELSEFVHFSEIFVREPATASDYGLYDITYSGSGGAGVEIQVASTGIQQQKY